MKEYLTKMKDGSYKLIPSKMSDDDIEVPEGAHTLTIGIEQRVFWKDNFGCNIDGFNSKEWRENDGFDKYMENYKNTVRILWQRHTQPEELPFVDDEPSLNDQYAEIEQVRQDDKVLKEILEGGQDNVNQPSHYCSHPSGIECIEITRHHDFAIGNAIKYLWRAGLKDSANEIQDLEKAAWYIQEKINQLKKVNDNP